jgi:hypothetical protein
MLSASGKGATRDLAQIAAAGMRCPPRKSERRKGDPPDGRLEKGGAGRSNCRNGSRPARRPGHFDYGRV